MSEQAAQEPTMEEILASIRRIISEDDAPAEGQVAAEAAPEAAPEPVAEAPVEAPALMDEAPSLQAAEDEVLELTEKVEEPAPLQSIGDLDVAPRFEPTPEPVAAAPEPAPAPAYTPAPTPSFTVASGSLDEMVRTIIEAEIKAWLAQNLDQVMRDITKEKFDRVFK
jgi:cell pole-organizing protein PopZ